MNGKVNIWHSYDEDATGITRLYLSEHSSIYYKELMASAKMDSIRWKEMYAENGYVSGDHNEYEKLKSFIRERLEFINKELTS